MRKMSSEIFNKTLELEMHGIRKSILIEETYNKYEDSPRKVQIDSMEGHGTFIMLDISEISDGCAVIEWIFVGASENKHLKSGYAKAGHILDGSRKLVALSARTICKNFLELKQLRIKRNYRVSDRRYR